MKKYLKEDSWKIIEERFDPGFHPSSESIFSLGNGHMGQRANFEEKYSGKSLQGHYIAGIYYPDKTRVGWWKNGYPEYFAKVLNAPSWIGIHVKLDSKTVDLAKNEVKKFTRILDMKTGMLTRECIVQLSSGYSVQIKSERFLSLTRKELGIIRYEVTPLDFTGAMELNAFVDAGIKNKDANYDETFWEINEIEVETEFTAITATTKKTGFQVTTAQLVKLQTSHEPETLRKRGYRNAQQAGSKYLIQAEAGQTYTLYKMAAVTTSRDYPADQTFLKATHVLASALEAGYDQLREEQVEAWAAKWEDSDIVIEGDLSAQQGIRFNIFQLNQTYTGHDARLNIGPKGFTGEKYGGSTYWDTEAYCLPFYLSTADQSIARNLLLYRYKQLDKAIENAQKLGFKNGAALYPMVTMNGEECHNEWEITFEEIHRNGAIAYAIMNYIRHTGEEDYLYEYGLEVLIAISRFWAQRVNYSAERKKYVMLGVTGPNEYENNINNNWYTNYLAVWTLKYTLAGLTQLKERDPGRFQELVNKVNLDHMGESAFWQQIVSQMHFPEDQDLGIFLQQDGYLDKEQILASELPVSERPINQHWSWDRILRSCFIKQADVLQGMYFFEDDFTEEQFRNNFDFYEPRTVHESSLSPCIHVILASKLKMPEKAYELYLRTSRLDLDDYNHEVHEGLHITSMAGTWLSVVEGFGGMRVRNDQLHFDPLIPDTWKSLKFRVHFRGRLIEVFLDHQVLIVKPLDNKPFRYFVDGSEQIAE